MKKMALYRHRRTLLRVVLISLIALGWVTPRTVYAAQIRYAISEGGLTSGECNSWQAACTLTKALEVAVSGDEIWVAAGVYMPSTDNNRLVSFALKEGVALYGGFAGAEASRSQRDWTANPVILSGNIGAPDDNRDNSETVVISFYLTSSAVLDGFTISDANDGIHGGGMLNYYSSPTLTNVTFSNNQARAGGGMHNYYSSPTLTDVTFLNNQANSGGGMYNYFNSSPSLTGVIFSSNKANQGGGMGNFFNSHPTLTNVTFSTNIGNSYGGGMYNYENSSPQLFNVAFNNNEADFDGGGMYNLNSSPTLTQVTFFENHTNGDGGGMYNRESSPVLTSVTFSGNEARFGGGMGNYSNSHPTLTNGTFYNNRANYGGGMVNDRSSPILTHITFSSNYAHEGGGMFNNGESYPKVRNSILWGNFNDQVESRDTNPVYIRTIIQGVPSSDEVINQDPLLALPGDDDPITLPLALLPGSPAIDAADQLCPPTDQRGVARSAPRCDLGAFESQGFQLAIHSGDYQRTAFLTAFPEALVVAVTANDPTEPVDGGQVVFSPPGSGPSAILVANPVTIQGGQARTALSANALIGGPYTVTASAAGGGSLTFSLTNTRLSQSISFGPLAPRTFSDADFEVSAAASSGLPVSFAAAGSCEMSGANQVHLSGAGSCTITASQAGSDDYEPAPQVQQTFVIAKAAAVLSLSGLTQVYDGTPKAVAVTTEPEGLPGVSVTYDGSDTAPTQAGSYAVVASLAHDHYQAEDVTGTLVIEPPPAPAPLTLYLPLILR